MTRTTAALQASEPLFEVSGSAAPLPAPGLSPQDAFIDEACRTLRLPTMRARFMELAEAARAHKYSYKQFLADLLRVECDEREVRRMMRLVRAAKFPRP
ncbi:MAG: hypothetical protein JO362_01050, partial [Streptomycetaceae bacterium]|nr:hypothetical protein [Streptomycetaceae bacterium]